MDGNILTRNNNWLILRQFWQSKTQNSWIFLNPQCVRLDKKILQSDKDKFWGKTCSIKQYGSGSQFRKFDFVKGLKKSGNIADSVKFQIFQSFIIYTFHFN